MPHPTPSQQQSMNRYRKFWQKAETDRPLIGFGKPYPAKHLRKNREVQTHPGPITLEMMNPEAFLPSYEEWFAFRTSLPGDLLYAVEPPNGFPWIEAMAGCGVVASGQGYSALHFVKEPADADKVVFDLDAPWARRYFEFMDVLGRQFKDRCGVGQPILRGISDLLGAIMGPENMVYFLSDEPKKAKAFIRRAIAFYVELAKEHWRRVPPFLGGYQIGFYDLWAPEPCLWLQDDNLVLFSPEMYAEFFLEFIETVTALSPYNLIHLHPVCFHNLELLLDVPTLGVAEVNREMTEKHFPDLIPSLQRIQEKKLLDVQGMFTCDDLRLALESLLPAGLQIKCLVEDPEEIPRLYEVFQQMTK